MSNMVKVVKVGKGNTIRINSKAGTTCSSTSRSTRIQDSSPPSGQGRRFGGTDFLNRPDGNIRMILNKGRHVRVDGHNIRGSYFNRMSLERGRTRLICHNVIRVTNIPHMSDHVRVPTTNLLTPLAPKRETIRKITWRFAKVFQKT
jgi:hypothetical protein